MWDLWSASRFFWDPGQVLTSSRVALLPNEGSVKEPAFQETIHILSTLSGTGATQQSLVSLVLDLTPPTRTDSSGQGCVHGGHGADTPS